MTLIGKKERNVMQTVRQFLVILLVSFVYLFGESEGILPPIPAQDVITLRNGETVGLGCIPERTLPAGVKKVTGIALETPDKSAVDLSEGFPPIRSQGGQGSCTAWAVGYYFKSYQEWHEHQWLLSNTDHQFSPAFVYNHINGGIDGGSYISDAFKLLFDLGCARWSDMPYDQYDFTSLPDETAYRQGINYRTQQTYALDLINDGIADLKNLLLNGTPAVIGINVYPNFDYIESYGNVYCLNDVYGDVRGGHAVTICGFDDDKVTSDGTGAFKLSNSWGSGFGEQGYFWMSYAAVQSTILCHGYAFYADDRIEYSPGLVATFNLDYDIRAAVDIKFGIGDHGTPQWTKKFFNWQLRKLTQLPFPTTNVVVDLTDGLTYLEQPQTDQLYLRCKDRRFFWHTSTWHAYSGKSWWCADEEIPGYDNGWLMFLDTPAISLGSNGGTLTFMLSYALEEPGSYENHDGWDGANVRISTDDFQSWVVLTGTPAYDYSSGYAWAYHGEGDNIPGWGGYQPGWQTATFDLSDYANQTVKIRFAFGSDPGWCSRDNNAYYGVVIDEISVSSDGQEVYYDDADGLKTVNQINYLQGEQSSPAFTVVCDQTPLIIPESGDYVYADLTFPSAGIAGDLNADDDVSVLDIVLLVGFILYTEQPTDYQSWAGDLDDDGVLSILDVIRMINLILN